MKEKKRKQERRREGKRGEREEEERKRKRGQNVLIIYQSEGYTLLTNRGIIVQEVVEDFCAYRETADQSSSQDGLFCVCNDTFFDKFYNTITKHFRMHP